MATSDLAKYKNGVREQEEDTPVSIEGRANERHAAQHGLQSGYLGSLPSRGRHTALVAAFPLRLGNTVTLPFEHRFTLGAAHGSEDGEHEPAGLQEVWSEAWLRLVLDRWQPTRHGSDQPGGKHGHEAECPGVATNRGRTRAMTVRVLVVDDEPDVETLFRQQFRREVREGLYTLDFALSALAALAILDDASGEKIILLVSDINMPGMSGLDLLPIVKTRRPDLPVFMISAYGDADTVATALARGADEFLTKPVDFPKLKQDIMAVMADATGGNG